MQGSLAAGRIEIPAWEGGRTLRKGAVVGAEVVSKGCVECQALRGVVGRRRNSFCPEGLVSELTGKPK